MKILFWLILLLSPYLSYAAPKIMVVGDSLSAGYGINYEQAWVNLLEEKLRIQYPDVEVINASISGDTTTGALARLPQALDLHQPDLVIIELGGNDGLRGLPIKRIKQNLQRIIELVSVNADPLLIQMRIPMNYGKKYTNLFEQAYRDIGDQTDVTLIPFLLDGIAGNPEYMQADRIHPKVNAQPLIVENVFPSILKALSKTSVRD